VLEAMDKVLKEGEIGGVVSSQLICVLTVTSGDKNEKMGLVL
jgi:hypothetical protein